MNRRRLILLLGGVVFAPRALRAQQKAMPVIGYLSPGSPGAAAPYVAAFRQGLSETGYTKGETWRSNIDGPRAMMTGCGHWLPISLASRST